MITLHLSLNDLGGFHQKIKEDNDGSLIKLYTKITGNELLVYDL